MEMAYENDIQRLTKKASDKKSIFMAKKIKYFFYLDLALFAVMILAIILSWIKISAIWYVNMVSCGFLALILLGLIIPVALIFGKNKKILGKGNKNFKIVFSAIFLIFVLILPLILMRSLFLDRFGVRQKVIETKITKPYFNDGILWNPSCFYLIEIPKAGSETDFDYFRFLCSDKNAQINDWTADSLYRLNALENSGYIVKAQKIEKMEITKDEAIAIAKNDYLTVLPKDVVDSFKTSAELDKNVWRVKLSHFFPDGDIHEWAAYYEIDAKNGNVLRSWEDLGVE